MIVVDTNVWSELMLPAPAGEVVTWAAANAATLALPSVAVGELRYGVSRLPDGRRKTSLSEALDALIARFSGNILSFDLVAARAYGDILATARRAGRPMGVPDAQIAAIARISRASLATRNVSDFATTGIALIDPWAHR